VVETVRNTAAFLLSLTLLGGACAPHVEPVEDTPVLEAPKDKDAREVQRRHETMVMGTKLELVALGEDVEDMDAAIAAAEREMRRIEDLMTTWRPSPLTRLNDAAGQGPQEVPLELAQIIDRGLALGELTEGAFDITFAGVGKLWSFKKGKERLPSPQEVEAAIARVDYRKVRVDLEASTVEVPEGMRIGLGGIAKGYAVDQAMKVMREHGVRNGVVNAGGDMKVLGKKFGYNWQVAIKHPRKRGRAIALLRISNSCVVSSGDYERFFEKDGKRYHHILDPRTGYPATGAMSSTVVAPNAEFADALATALCVLGAEKGLALIQRLPRVEAIIVDMDEKIHTSPALLPSVRDQ
jgi:thiamine biosynthesis lipoprotein